MEENKTLFIETFGCQMNFSDSEIVASVMKKDAYLLVNKASEADVIFLNTCSIRDNAEQRIRARLMQLQALKKKKGATLIGVLGCMAERLKERLLDEEVVDLIAGPDAYRNLPELINQVKSGQKAANTLLSGIETYEDIQPVRYDTNKVSAFISIMRGCQNYCAYCVVPYTRGKERSRNSKTILEEAKVLFELGYREVTLLGQNVNSYQYEGSVFAELMAQVAEIHPQLRVRFATSHPKDISDELIKVIAHYPNICRSVHLPVQSGSNAVLKNMKRGYTREYYMERVDFLNQFIPDCGLSTDLIAGFCGETEEDHQQTLSLMKWAGFDLAYMFAYSSRPGTYAANKLQDDVPQEIKNRRLSELISLQRSLSDQSNQKDVGTITEVLVEGPSKRSVDFLSGRNSRNKVVVFPKLNYKRGDYVNVKVERVTTATLIGTAV